MTAFLLVCSLSGIMSNGIYFQNVNHCIDYRDKLNQQTFMRDDKPQTYECICKLIPFVDTKKVKVY